MSGRAGPAGIVATYSEAPRPARLLIFGMMINRLGAFLPFFLVLYLTSTGYSASDAGLALGAYGVGGVVGGIVGGWLTDRFGRRRTIVCSSAATGAMTAGVFYAPNLLFVVGLVGVVGALSYAYRPASSALLADLVPADRYTMIFAMYRLATSIGTAGGPLIGAALAAYSFGLIFWVEAVVLFAFAGAAHLMLPPDRPHHATAPAPEPDAPPAPEPDAPPAALVLRDYRFVLFLVSVLTVSMVYFQHLSTLPLQVIADGRSTGVYAALVALNAVIVTVFELPLTTVVQRWSPRTALTLNYTLIGAGMAMYTLHTGVPGLVLATIVWSIGEIIGAPTFFSYPARIAPPGSRGRYLGAAGAMMSLGFAIGPALGTPLWTLMGREFWLACSVVCVLSVIAVYFGVLPSDDLSARNARTAQAATSTLEAK